MAARQVDHLVLLIARGLARVSPTFLNFHSGYLIWFTVHN